MTPMTMMTVGASDIARAQQITQAQEQRRLKHLSALTGMDATEAATVKKKLLYGRLAPILLGAALGLGGGALAGAWLGKKYQIDPFLGDTGNKVMGGYMGGVLGAGIGTILGAAPGLYNSITADVTNMPRNELASRLKNIGLKDILIPGRASYLDAKLYKDFLANEKDRPTQYVV